MEGVDGVKGVEEVLAVGELMEEVQEVVVVTEEDSTSPPETSPGPCPKPGQVSCSLAVWLTDWMTD